jgi:hypothetical protein
MPDEHRAVALGYDLQFRHRAHAQSQHELRNRMDRRGPHEWTIRPVAEARFEHQVGPIKIDTISALVGGIWKVRDDLKLEPIIELSDSARTLFDHGVFDPKHDVYSSRTQRASALR